MVTILDGTPNMDSPILKVLKETYTNLNGQPPHVAACHAGLEVRYPWNALPRGGYAKSWSLLIKGAHSPDERASIASVKRSGFCSGNFKSHSRGIMDLN